MVGMLGENHHEWINKKKGRERAGVRERRKEEEGEGEEGKGYQERKEIIKKGGNEGGRDERSNKNSETSKR